MSNGNNATQTRRGEPITDQAGGFVHTKPRDGIPRVIYETPPEEGWGGVIERLRERGLFEGGEDDAR